MANRKTLFTNTSNSLPFLDCVLSEGDSVSFGGVKLTNIANGVDSTDVINKGQLLPTSALVTDFTFPAGTGSGSLALRQYLYPSGRVGLVGQIDCKLGVILANTTLCTLDADYRPSFEKTIPICSSNGSFCYVTIGTDGKVKNSRALTILLEYLLLDLGYYK